MVYMGFHILKSKPISVGSASCLHHHYGIYGVSCLGMWADFCRFCLLFTPSLWYIWGFISCVAGGGGGGGEMLLLFCYCYVLLALQPSLSSSTHAYTRSFIQPSSRGHPRAQIPAPPHTTTMKRFKFQLFTVERLNHCANLKPGY